MLDLDFYRTSEPISLNVHACEHSYSLLFQFQGFNSVNNLSKGEIITNLSFSHLVHDWIQTVRPQCKFCMEWNLGFSCFDIQISSGTLSWFSSICLLHENFISYVSKKKINRVGYYQIVIAQVITR